MWSLRNEAKIKFDIFRIEKKRIRHPPIEDWLVFQPLEMEYVIM